jgi:hypothetical protein
LLALARLGGKKSRRRVPVRTKRTTLLWIAVFLGTAASASAQSDGSTGGESSGFFARWFQMVSRTQAEQPHWVTPLATTTPRLEQEFRYDIFWQRRVDGTTTENYDGGKGLELIPLPNVEVILSLPPYIVHNKPAVRDGFGDFSLLLKYRLLSRNEESGSYILTAFLGLSFPTGSAKNGARRAILTPTIAYGKGWRRFDVQGTFGVGLPTGDTNIVGRTFAWNNAFQYRVFRRFWPEVEINSTFFQNGPNDGRKQVFLTPGLVVGRIPLWKRLGLTVGGSVQIATTHFHTNNHNSILSVRFPF